MIDQVSITNYYSEEPKLNNRETEVYRALRQLGDATSWEILEYLRESNPNYVRPRLTDLLVKGIIVKSRQVKVNGILQWVWVIADKYKWWKL